MSLLLGGIVLSLLLLSCGRPDLEGDSVTLVGSVSLSSCASALGVTNCPVAGVTISIREVAGFSTTSDVAGSYSIAGIPFGKIFHVIAQQTNQTSTTVSQTAVCTIRVIDLFSLELIDQTPDGSCSTTGQTSQPGTLNLNIALS
ncbi:MAG TPA: hypothetical protein VFG95_05500 [Nitrospiria bacterium]|nr:hypothetical protein [Nitrospiria bacterium]